MHELVAIIVLFLALIVVLIGFNMKPPVVQAAPLPQPEIIQPAAPIYFPRPIYPFPRFGYSIRPSPPRPRPSFRR